MHCTCKSNAITPKIPTLLINDHVRAQLVQRFQKLNIDPYLNFHTAALRSSEILEQELSFGTFQALLSFSKSKKIDGAFLIKGFPVCLSSLPPTPTEDNTTNGKDYLSEYLILGLSHLLKTIPYINNGEKDGRIIHQIIPIEGKEKQLSSSGSETLFDWHTENVHEVSPPNYLSLFCLKGEANAKTTVFTVKDLVENLPNRIVNILFKESYEFKTGPSYNLSATFQGSVLSTTVEGGFQIRYNSSESRLNGLDKESKDALNFIRYWLKNHATIQEVTLVQGDCLILDNRKTLHGRTSFKMSPSLENRRWLQRVYLRKI